MDNSNLNSVLIVDDSATNLVLLEAILQEEGYRTFTAFNAKEAFSIIEHKKPDIILLDLLMPQVSGFDILEKLKYGSKTAIERIKQNIQVGDKYQADNFDLITWFLINA